MKVEFKLVKESDLELLRQWRNSVFVSQFMYSQQLITKEQQYNWYQNLLLDETKQYFVCYVENKPVGCLYFSDISNSSCYWGCYIGEVDKAWVGTGIVMEVAALDFALDYLKLTELNAEVITTNKPPLRLHNMFQYERGEDYRAERAEEVFSVARFQYTRDRWCSNRAKVLSKLPGAISVAACSASFWDNSECLIYQLKELNR